MDKDIKQKSDSEEQEIKTKYQNFVSSFRDFFSSIVKIEDTDILGTIEDVKKDMVFRGASAWILIFSILIASIGLNANSTAVIIGAMLISPLMGPIVAIGLSLGTNDFDLFKRAIKNYLVAIIISLITSTLYFLLTPLKEATSELFSRTSPTILDVFIAFFGGFAGIIGASRRERSNVIPGVAIATALMPPLCTAGYGLATWQMHFFFGALYLFFINSVFISLATVVTVRLMKFPHKTFVDHKKEKLIKRWMTIFAIIVIIPSLIIFLNVIRESRFKTNAQHFVNKIVKYPGSQLINAKFDYNDSTAIINLYFIGQQIKDSAIRAWMLRLPDFGLVANKKSFGKFMLPDTTILKVYQSGSQNGISQKDLEKMNQTLQQEIRVGVLEDIYKKNEQIIAAKDREIKNLTKKLKNYNKNYIPINQLYKELKIQYPRIISFSYGQNLKIYNDSLIDTIPTFIIKWKHRTSYHYKNQKIKMLKKWLKIRFNLDTLTIVEER
jgi:uncharacterized hydrophobic protein (TIGR00271 family)